MIDDDVLGRAYDSRLMRRLLTYLRPYKPQVSVAIVAIIGHAVLDLAPPYLTKIVIDRYIPIGDLADLERRILAGASPPIRSYCAARSTVSMHGPTAQLFVGVAP